jgi:hypothetical protein
VAVLHQASTGTNGFGNTASVTAPPGTAAGDVLIANFQVSAASVTVTPPAGWTQFALQNTSFPLYGFWKVAGPSEPFAYTFTLGSSQSWEAAISRFSGVDTTTPIDVTAQTGSSGFSTSLTVNGVTTVTTNAFVLGGVGFGSTTTAVPPAGLTEFYDVQGVESAGAVQVSPGATGNKTWTFAASTGSRGWLTALRPGSPPASINPNFIASAEQVFSPALIATQYVNANFIGSAGQVFSPQVLTSGQVGPSFIPSSEQVFAPQVQVTAGPQATTPNFIGTSGQVFQPAVVAARQISPSFIPTAEAFFPPVLTVTGLAASRVRAAHGPAVHVVVDHEPTP